LSDEQIAQLAANTGMTPDEFRQYVTTPHAEMTCPLCGQPSTHLVNCKGCGGDAWGWEFEAAYGEGSQDQLRQWLQSALAELGAGERAQIAAQHAYQFGGCSVCAVCWHHTLPADAFETCPLKLFADRLVTPHQFPTGLMAALLDVPHQDKPRALQVIEQWIHDVYAHWTDHWNTVMESESHQAIADWRHGIIHAALSTAKTKDVRDDSD
jgi:hypothetical protein